MNQLVYFRAQADDVPSIYSVREKGIPIPKIHDKIEEQTDREAYEELVYEYGKEGLPKSIHAKYGRLIQAVEAAELPPRGALANVESDSTLHSNSAVEADAETKKKGGFRDRKVRH